MRADQCDRPLSTGSDILVNARIRAPCTATHYTWREVRQPDDEAIALEGHGEVHLRKEKRKQGVGYLRQALEIYRKLGMLAVGQVTTRLADIGFREASRKRGHDTGSEQTEPFWEVRACAATRAAYSHPVYPMRLETSRGPCRMKAFRTVYDPVLLVSYEPIRSSAAAGARSSSSANTPVGSATASTPRPNASEPTG